MKRHIQKRFACGLGVVLLAGLSLPSWAQPPGGPDFDGGPGFGREGGFGRGGGFGGPGGGRFDGGGNFGGRRNSPKSQLTRWLEGVQRLDANSQTTLSKAQAKKILALVTPWRTRKTMTDAEATALHTRLTTVLTVAQKSELAEGGRFGGPGGGPGGLGGGRRGGDRGREGGPGGPFGDGPPEGRPPEGGPDGFGGPRGRGGEGPDGGGFGPPPGGFGGESGSATEMKAPRETMQTFMKSNNPLVSPKSNVQFAKLPEPMRQRMLERSKTQSDFLARLQKKAK